jgi:hypothetical protein
MSRNRPSACWADQGRPLPAQLTLGPRLEQVCRIAKAPEDHAVSGIISFDSTVARGSVTVPGHSFGIEITRVRIDHVTWSSAGGILNIQARILADCHWEIHSRGRINVTGGTDASVTAGTWRKIAADLEPDTTGRPTRADFWAQDLSACHEQFHAMDDIHCGQLQMPAVQVWLDSQTITGPATDAKVQALLSVVRSKIQTEIDNHYLSGGEDRAYANNKACYEQRIRDIYGRATMEGWA